MTSWVYQPKGKGMAVYLTFDLDQSHIGIRVGLFSITVWLPLTTFTIEWFNKREYDWLGEKLGINQEAEKGEGVG